MCCTYYNLHLFNFSNAHMLNFLSKLLCKDYNFKQNYEVMVTLWAIAAQFALDSVV